MSKGTIGDEEVTRLDLDRMGSADFTPTPLKVGQLIELERRLNEGLPISDEERRQLVAAKEKLQEVFHGVRESFARVAEQLRPMLFKLPDAIRQFGQWQKDVSALLSPIIAQMAKAYREMPLRIQAVLLELGKRGWYLDGQSGFSELWELEGWLAAGNVDKVDAALIAHFESRLPKIEVELIKALPAREKILEGGFRRAQAR